MVMADLCSKPGEINYFILKFFIENNSESNEINWIVRTWVCSVVVSIGIRGGRFWSCDEPMVVVAALASFWSREGIISFPCLFLTVTTWNVSSLLSLWGPLCQYFCLDKFSPQPLFFLQWVLIFLVVYHVYCSFLGAYLQFFQLMKLLYHQREWIQAPKLHLLHIVILCTC